MIGGLDLSPGAFAGLIIGIIAFFVLLGVLLLIIRSKRRKAVDVGESDTTRLIGKRNTGTASMLGEGDKETVDGLKSMTEKTVDSGAPIYWNKYI